jgi:hypothetical protein
VQVQQQDQVVVHLHANGLAIVTADIPNIKSVRYLVEPPDFSVGASERRKRITNLLKGKTNIPDVVTPGVPLAELELSDASTLTVPAGVWGCLMELNQPEKIVSCFDPLMDGFLAIIQPAGSFPPSNTTSSASATENKVTTEGDGSEGLDAKRQKLRKNIEEDTEAHNDS